MRSDEHMQKLIQHMGRLRGHSWAATSDAEESKRRIDILLLEGETATELHREIADYKRSL